MWKIFIGILSDKLYDYLKSKRLLIDKMILRNCKRNMIELGMTWIDYKKAFAMVPYSWFKILWHFSLQTNCKLELNKSDILIVDKQTGECHIIDAACPFDTRVKKKEQEKVQQYHELKRHIVRLGNANMW